MAIDMHWVYQGRIKETWHCAEWLDAVGQLKGEDVHDEQSGKYPLLHHGQLVMGTGA